jgi:hypothetical protein
MLSPQNLLKPFLLDDDRSPRTLRAMVVTHVGSICAATMRNELLPDDLADVIARRLTGLFDELDKLSEEHQRLMLAATGYFLSGDNHRPCTVDAKGLDVHRNYKRCLIRWTSRTAKRRVNGNVSLNSAGAIPPYGDKAP